MNECQEKLLNELQTTLHDQIKHVISLLNVNLTQVTSNLICHIIFAIKIAGVNFNP
jgi:hypothetical protein